MKKNYNIEIDEEHIDLRLDTAISKIVPDLTRSSVKNHATMILVNGKKEKLSYVCRLSDQIYLEIEFEDFDNVIPENIDLDIKYEDDNYIVINKSHDMVVHPAKGNFKGTLLNALLGLNKTLYQSDNILRPGIVHRLDKETSGLIIVAKNQKAHLFLSKLFKTRKITKKYHAIVKGIFLPSQLTIDNLIGRHPKNRKKMAVLNNDNRGKRSITSIEKVKHFDDFSYLDIKLLTGRTHQIRVHLSNYGFPILGDKIYGKSNKSFPETQLCLVAYKIEFFDRLSGKKLSFKIEDPVHMKRILHSLKNKIH